MTRLLFAGALAMLISLFGTKALINWLTTHRIGQPIRDDGPEGHHLKAGTPTMGGLAIVAGATVGYVVSDLVGAIYTRTGIFVMLAIIGGGAVGLVDDWIKVVAARNLGLNKRAKMLGLLIVGVGFAFLVTQYTNVPTTLSFTRFDNPGWDLGRIGWMVWALLLITATTNAVNLTDGLDGLAAGAGAFGFAAFTVIGFWQFRHADFYDNPHALDLAVVAAAMVGGIIGFLWWNAAAQIFMGDTGSLAIGSGLAARPRPGTHLLLPIIGGLFVMETVSVILQIVVFRRFDGKRLFRMAPIHHHFELSGWPETTVIVRLWIMSACALALASACSTPARSTSGSPPDGGSVPRRGSRLADVGFLSAWAWRTERSPAPSPVAVTPSWPSTTTRPTSCVLMRMHSASRSGRATNSPILSPLQHSSSRPPVSRSSTRRSPSPTPPVWRSCPSLISQRSGTIGRSSPSPAPTARRRRSRLAVAALAADGRVAVAAEHRHPACHGDRRSQH